MSAGWSFMTDSCNGEPECGAVPSSFFMVRTLMTVFGMCRACSEVWRMEEYRRLAREIPAGEAVAMEVLGS